MYPLLGYLPSATILSKQSDSRRNNTFFRGARSGYLTEKSSNECHPTKKISTQDCNELVVQREVDDDNTVIIASGHILPDDKNVINASGHILPDDNTVINASGHILPDDNNVINASGHNLPDDDNVINGKKGILYQKMILFVMPEGILYQMLIMLIFVM